MKLKRRYVVAAVFMVLAITLGPPIERTAHIGADSGGLLLIASMMKEDLSLNPWSKNCLALGPNQAAWILENFDWPYRGKDPHGFIGVPLLHMATNDIGLTSDPKRRREKKDRMLRLIEVFLERGESPESRYVGFTAIHSAIVSGSVEAVILLTEGGADLHARAVRPGHATDGLDSLELAQYFSSKHPEIYGPVFEYLSSIRNET